MTCKIDKRPKLTYFPNRKRHLPLLVRLENQEKIYSSENFERLFIRYKGEAYPRGESVQKFCQRNNAPYTNSFWDQIFLYRKDGNYTIDNSLAERRIRPFSNERKNSLSFGCDKMAYISAAYLFIVSTRELQGYSILEYLKRFFEEIAAGNSSYGKLMPPTIGISANNL